jgi:hypothetical protein
MRSAEILTRTTIGYRDRDADAFAAAAWLISASAQAR